MKSFEIRLKDVEEQYYKEWTINLKSFEILEGSLPSNTEILMNYKLEKFWNILCLPAHKPNFKWTINLKSFEIKVATADPNSAINEL